MKIHFLLATIAVSLSGLIGSIGANAATLGQPTAPIVPPSIIDSAPGAPGATPEFNPAGIQSILSNNGDLSKVFGGIVTAFPGLDPNIASALTTAAKYAPIAQSVLAGQQPTPAQIGQVASGMNGGAAVGIKFGDYGLDAQGKIQALNPDGSVKTDDPTGKMIAYQASNVLNGKGLDFKAVSAQIDLAKAKSGAGVVDANRQNTNKAVASIMGATNDSNNSTMAVAADQASISANAGSSFSRMGAMNNLMSQSLNTATTLSTIGLATLSQGENRAKHEAFQEHQALMANEQKRVAAKEDSLANVAIDASRTKARLRLCASTNICWF
jgi:hypothetical protein